jgi:hypothetical protein
VLIFAGVVWVRLRAAEGEGVVRQAPAGRAGITEPDAAAAPMSDGTIVTTTEDSQPGGTLPAATEGTIEEQRAVSAREQRYRELLRTPAPAAPAKEPSLVDRVLDPIASALGVSRQSTPASTRPAVQPTPTNPRSMPTQQAQEKASSADRDELPREKTESIEDDGSSDLVPPQLLTADFNPPQVQDGETTQFAAMVTDNLSGVRSVSGVIVNPSGSVQGFSCTKEGETNRFLAAIKVAKDAPEGTYLVKYLTLMDNASNTVNLNSAQGALPPTAQFKVVSNDPDAKGPQLKAVWLDRQAMRGGERNTMFVQAEDEKTGIQVINGSLISPAKFARLGFSCKEGTAGTWECAIQSPTCLDCGVWKLEQLQLQDKANNLVTYRGDNPLVAGVFVDINADICDAQPPTVTSLLVETPVVKQGTAARLVATMMDEGGCGPSSLSGQAVPTGVGQRVYFSFRQSGESWIADVQIPEKAAKGLWSLAWVQAHDKGYNLRTYPSTDPTVSKVTFRVE